MVELGLPKLKIVEQFGNWISSLGGDGDCSVAESGGSGFVASQQVRGGKLQSVESSSFLAEARWLESASCCQENR